MQVGSSIYLDYQATTPLDPLVGKKMADGHSDFFANPHSTQHILGQKAAGRVDQARSDIESLINADHEEVIFTSGATEANNQAIASVMFANNNADRNKILISAVEHKCIKNAAYFYGTKLGYQVEEIPVLPSGLIDIDAYQSMLSEQVVLVCIMAVNNEIGTIQDIKKLAELAHSVGALFHCDAAQAPEAQDIDVKAWGVDMLSLSAHKFYGPKGIGALFINNTLQAKLPALIHGGGQQEGMRSGTVPTSLCVGFAEALKLSLEEAENSRSRLQALSQRFLEQLGKTNVKFRVNGTLTQRHPGNLNIEFIGADATALLQALQPDVCVSTGSACNSDMVLLSHVLKAIGLSDEQVSSSVRVSIGRFSDEQQIDRAVAVLSSRLKAAL